jgi:hypothetical protein
MANYQPPTEFNPIFDPTKFKAVSLSAQGGTDAELEQEVQDLTTVVNNIATYIDNIGPVVFVPSTFWDTNCRALVSGVANTFTFTGFVSGGTYYVDFQLGFMSAGFNNTTDWLYGFNPSLSNGANFWTINGGSGTTAANFVAGNFITQPYTAGGLAAACFMSAHCSCFVVAPTDGTISLTVNLTTVNKAGTVVNGTYSINSNPANAPGSAFISPYLSLSTNSCKFVRVH